MPFWLRKAVFAALWKPLLQDMDLKANCQRISDAQAGYLEYPHRTRCRIQQVSRKCGLPRNHLQQFNAIQALALWARPH
jgi:hypothetical protein